MRRLFLLGGGGHAKVVVDAARAMGDYDVTGIFDDDPARQGGDVLGVPVLGPICEESFARHEARLAVIAIGDNRMRRQIACRYGHLVEWATIVHPRAIVAASATLGRGTVVMAGAVVQPAVVIGEHVILNTVSSVDHDSEVGSFAHLAPGVHAAGGVRIGEGALIGIGAVALPERTIGAWATVGAGAVVVRDVQGGAIVKGVPARDGDS
ncbi:MAG TPA: acetyltransferase [Thermomicrobiales bacterium]|nr:acetyltransferase [Thermomicrobiales bacterium]